jgi:hypothetical protein
MLAAFPAVVAGQVLLDEVINSIKHSNVKILDFPQKTVAYILSNLFTILLAMLPQVFLIV